MEKKTTKPQADEPCNFCRHWDNGCKIGRYESASMIIFGYCGFCQLKPIKA